MNTPRTAPIRKHYAALVGKEFKDCTTQQEQALAHELANEVAGKLIVHKALKSHGMHYRAIILGEHPPMPVQLRMGELVEFYSFTGSEQNEWAEGWIEAPLSLLMEAIYVIS